MTKKNIAVAVFALFLVAVFALQSKGDADTNTFTTYNTPGVYGPETGYEVINGDLVIQSANIKLQNLQITGNVYLTGTIAGQVELDNVTIDNILAINSAGEPELIIHNSTIAFLSISSATGTISITTANNAIVETLDIRAKIPITLAGTFNHISATTPANLSLTDASVDRLEVQENESVTNIFLNESSYINALWLHAATNLLGEGTVVQAHVLASGCWFEMDPQQVQFAAGITLSSARNDDIVRNDDDEEEEEEEGLDDESLTPIIIYQTESFTLRPGEQESQTISALPANVDLTAVSNNENVATVTVSGMIVTVTAHRSGTARILVSASHDEHSGAAVPFTVTVSMPTATAPTASPNSGEVEAGHEITLSTSTPNGIIYYTTNGSSPSTSSTRYSASNRPRVPADGVTIRAITVRDGYATSSASSFTYTVHKEDLPEDSEEEVEENENGDENEQ